MSGNPALTLEVPYYLFIRQVYNTIKINPKNLDPSYKVDLEFWFGGLGEGGGEEKERTFLLPNYDCSFFFLMSMGIRR